MRIRIVSLLFVLSLISASFFACAKDSPSTQRVTNVYKQSPLALPENMSASKLYPTSDGVFLSAVLVENDTAREIILRLDADGGCEELDPELSATERIVGIAAQSDGEIILLTFVRDTESGDGDYLLSRLELGERSVIHNDAAALLGMGGDITDLELDSHGNIYFSVKNSVTVLDKQLNLQLELELPSRIEALCTDRSGAVLACFVDAGHRMCAAKIDLEAGKLGDRLAVPDLKRFERAEVKFAAVGEEGEYLYYLDANTGLYGVRADGECELLCDWINSDIVRSAIGELVVLDSRRMLCRTIDGISLLSRIPDAELQEKQLIRVAVRYADLFTASRLVAFNRQSDKYRAVLVEYGGENTSTDSTVAELRISADMRTKNSPDVIALGDFMLADEWVKSRALLELSKLLSDGKGITETDFVDGITEIFSYNGKIYELVERFTLSTLLAKRENLPSDSWNMAGFLDFAEGLPDGTVLCEAGVRLDDLLPLSMGRYTKGGEAGFDNDEFKRLLTLFCESDITRRYEDTVSGDELADYRMGGRSRILREDRVVLSRLELENVARFISGTVQFGGAEVTAIGYPTDSGNGALVNAQSSWGIAAKTRVPDGAFELIGFLIENSSGFGFAAAEELFAEECAQECEKCYFFAFSGAVNGFEKDGKVRNFGSNGILRDITEEDTREIRELIRGASRLGAFERGMMAIINEEASAYFSGAKSIEDTIAIINDRVGTYVRESN